MLTIERSLNIYAAGIPQIISLSQYDDDFQLVFTLYTSEGEFTIPSGTTAEVMGTKVDGNGYSASASISGSTVTVTGNKQMTACAGRNVYEIVLTKSGKRLATVNFILKVERAALDADTIQSETVLKELNAIIDSAETSTQAAAEAAASAAAAAESARTLTIDPTLTKSGQAADAKVVGDEISGLKEEIDEFSGGLTPQIKEALLNCFAHVGWDHDSDKSYYDALEEALYADDIKSISAVFTPGTHEVYPTDNIESLRNFLVVTATYNDDTQAVVTDYTLEGDIASTGTKTITVKYGRTKTTTFSVNVVTNTNGLLYEWDFTKGTTDLRQNKETRSLGHSSSLPHADSSGLHFDAYGEAIVLFEGSEISVDGLTNKTIQIDVASFVPGNTAYHTRLLMMREGNVWNSGVVYHANVEKVGWSVYASTNGWGSIFNGMTQRNAISGHTVGIYIDKNKNTKLYIDSVSKGVQSVSYPSNLVGLMLGNHEAIEKGATFFNALVTGVRIYNGEVA